MDQFDGGWWLLDQDIQRGSGERGMFKAREEGLSFCCDGPCARSGYSPDVRFPLIATVLQTSLEGPVRTENGLLRGLFFTLGTLDCVGAKQHGELSFFSAPRDSAGRVGSRFCLSADGCFLGNYSRLIARLSRDCAWRVHAHRRFY